jgi:hypothetical protein
MPLFRGIIVEAIVYHYVALDSAYKIVRAVLCVVAASFWILYFREILLRSGRIHTQWLKKGLANLLVMLSIALVTFFVFIVASGFHSPHRAR